MLAVTEHPDIAFAPLPRSIDQRAIGPCTPVQLILGNQGNDVVELRATGGNGFGKLETVNLPDTIEKIGDRAFYYCDIESIVLPKGLKEIGDHAFYECDLEKVYYRGSEAEWGGY